MRRDYRSFRLFLPSGPGWPDDRKSASAGTALAPVTAPGKKPDRPVVKLPEKSVPVPSVSRPTTMFPWLPRIPGATVNRVAVPDKVVALTFDDGPHGTLTPKVLDILRNNNVKVLSSCRAAM